MTVLSYTARQWEPWVLMHLPGTNSLSVTEEGGQCKGSWPSIERGGRTVFYRRKACWDISPDWLLLSAVADRNCKPLSFKNAHKEKRKKK